MAWVLTTAAVAVVLLGVLIGQLGADDTLARARAEASERTLARAQLLEDTDPADPTDSARPGTGLARWTAPDGHEIEGRVVVGSARSAGDTVAVWLDSSGRIVGAPITVGSATVVGWTWGVAVALAGWSLLALLWTGVRSFTESRNAAAWAREWASVEPVWSGRVL